MFKIYKKNYQNKNTDESYYLNQKAILEITVSSNNLKIIRSSDNKQNQSLIQNFSPNTRDYQILLEENSTPNNNMNSPQLKLSFSNLSLKLEIKCWHEVGDYVTIQMINNLKNFEHVNLGLLDEENYVLMAFNSFVTGPDFIKELYNALQFTY
ncbi:MAG: hypothetical protein RBQ97_09150 [Acholeplasma sp.]|nr:hypothetical protein [Acholeplasma sp.]